MTDVLASWTVEGAEKAGFEGFRRFADLPNMKVPQGDGVYLILRVAKDQPEFLSESGAGRFKGRNPSVSAAKLALAWVVETEVVYIGKAASGALGRRGLRKRLDEYRRFGAGEPIGHWGGRYVWQVHDHDLLVAWRATDAPEADETALIAAFESHYGRMPFANLRH